MTTVQKRDPLWGLFQSVIAARRQISFSSSSNIIGTASWGIDTFVESNETVHQPNKKPSLENDGSQ
jgi:hypothetical protein